MSQQTISSFKTMDYFLTFSGCIVLYCFTLIVKSDNPDVAVPQIEIEDP